MGTKIFYKNEILTCTNNCFIISARFIEIGSDIMSKEFIKTQMKVKDNLVSVLTLILKVKS